MPTRVTYGSELGACKLLIECATALHYDGQGLPLTRALFTSVLITREDPSSTTLLLSTLPALQTMAARLLRRAALRARRGSSAERHKLPRPRSCCCCCCCMVLRLSAPGAAVASTMVAPTRTRKRKKCGGPSGALNAGQTRGYSDKRQPLPRSHRERVVSSTTPYLFLTYTLTQAALQAFTAKT